jgi:NAD(P)H dehydrogenase (quinone)
MKHLVVVAHPAVGSFTMALAREYAAELEALGHSRRTLDLYRMGFDPVLTAEELSPAADRPLSMDVAKAQDEIRAADVLTLIYPLWWLSMPAIMKGYIDRVFARGFAYDSRSGVVRGLLSGKQSVLITVSGAPLPLLVKSGNWNAIQVLQDTHILRSTGFTLLEHLHFDEIVPNLSSAAAERCMTRVRECARSNFAAALA